MGKDSKVVYKLRPDTARSYKFIQNNFKIENGNVAVINLDTYSDAGKIKEMCEVFFDDDFSKMDFETMDLAPVKEGVNVFLLRALSV